MNKLTSILHLEDDDNDAELVQAMLELGDISCQITRVQTGGEFDQALCKENFDLILADYRLPGYDGISALRRAQERCPDVPFIFVSGIMGEDAAIDGLTQGATDYVLKNKLVRLSSAVKRALAEADNKKERKQAEETVRESEARFRVVANSANDGIVSTDSQGIVFYWNQTAQTIFGYTEDEIVGQSLTMLMPERHQESYQAALNRWFGSQENRPLSRTVEAVGRRKDGVEFPIELSVGGWETREGTFFTAIIRDITERKRAEDERQAHLRFFQSMDQINRAIQSTNELNQMMSAVLSAVISIFDCDRSFLMYPCDPKADAWFSPMECTRPEYPGILAAGQKLPMDSEVALTLQLLLDSDGPVKFGPGNDHPLPADVSERFGIKSFMSLALYPWVDVPWQFGIHQCSYARIWTPDDERLFQEIGRRLTDALTSLLSYRNLLESEERYRRLVELSPDVIAILSQERIVFVNPAMLRLHAAKSEADLIEKSIFDFIDPDDHEIAKKCIGESARGENLGLFVEIKFLRFDGSTVDVEVAGVPYEAGGLQYTQIIARDITQRKQHELEREAIITVSNALRRATNRSEILTIILDQVLELFDADGAMLAVPNSITQGIIIEMGRGTVGNRFSGLNIPPGLGVSAWVIENKQPYLSNKADSDALFYRADLLAGSHCVAAVPLIANEQAIGALWIARRTELMERDLRLLNAIGDIAANALHRVTLHEQTEMHLRHLMALHQIDIAITTNFDLSVTLNIILGNVKNELVMDAASILLLTPFTL
jgi:PAS domain S-box-containing protein